MRSFLRTRRRCAMGYQTWLSFFVENEKAIRRAFAVLFTCFLSVAVWLQVKKALTADLTLT